MYLFFDQGDVRAGLLIMQHDNSLSPPLPSPNHPMILPSATAGDGSHDWHRPEYHYRPSVFTRPVVNLQCIMLMGGALCNTIR